MADLYPFVNEGSRAMVFVDGENLAIRYGNALKASATPPRQGIFHIPNVAVWIAQLSPISGNLPGTRVIRKHYYTSIHGDDMKVHQTADSLKQHGFEAPRVFKKDKNKGSKRVDISLATDMLLHAF